MRKILWVIFVLLPAVLFAQTDTESVTIRNYTVNSENGDIRIVLDYAQINAEMDLGSMSRAFDVGSVRWELRYSIREIYYKGVKVPLSNVPSLGNDAIVVENMEADLFIGASRFKRIRIGGLDFTSIKNNGGRGNKNVFDDTFDLDFGENEDWERMKEYFRTGITIQNIGLQARYGYQFDGAYARNEFQDYLKQVEFDGIIEEADQLYNAGNYEAADEKYRAALRIQRGNEHALNRIEEIKKLLATQQANEKYDTAMQNANSATSVEEKVKYYNEALEAKPNDPEATNALNAISGGEEGQASGEAGEGSAAAGTAAGAAAGTAGGAGSSSGTTSGSESGEAETKSAAEIEQERIERERKRQQELAEAREEYTRKNAAIAASSAAASAGFLYFIGGMIYGDIGKIDVDNLFLDKGWYLGLTYGYSTHIQPIFFNVDSDAVSGARIEETDTRYAWTMNVDLQLNLGYETKMIGGYGYVNPYGGFSPLFDTFTYSLNYGGRVFAGLENIKGYYDLSQGERYVYKFDYITGDSGTGEIFHKYVRHEYGLMITLPSNKRFIRSHMMIGLVTDQILNLTDDYDTYSAVQNVDELSLELLPSSSFSSQVVTGVTFQFKKDQHFNLYVNLFPEYPFTGVRKYGFSDDAGENDNILLEVGFVRALDQWK
ncbi:tetratricopeptide repeat protein [Balneola sp. MJW-20]|uniref:tetratricopeptide repeat protein n=1 Tax=Gracilimonas aurantiaca TaxID=3234185 RepID=UPI0034654B0D